ncbi:MAG: argininosuccinate lyase [Chloroflexi bacterium]|nr:MAG: argininosuccinate lyase [Chloroflexota bacterium]
MWGGRFEGETDPRAADFGRSIEVDRALAADDLQGSIAHVHGLARAGVLTAEEESLLVEGLQALAADVQAGGLRWDPALEDVHLNLEAALAAKIGPLAGKLHTGRSRNDQIATDLRLWLRRTIDGLDSGVLAFELALVELAERNEGAILPGSTHLQPAQPVLLAHHLLAYVEMLERDRERLADCRRRANVSPLGSGAVAGTGFPIDREAVADELGFSGATANSIDAVSDRDFAVEFLAAAALAEVHLSRLAEEITWWSNPAFGFVRVADAFSTGSSMMPNKRNPDTAELIRAKAARVAGNLTTCLMLLKGLPLAYQRDLQETVPPLLDGAAALEASLAVLTGLVGSLEVDIERMASAAASGHTTATAVADSLVERGVPFRAAHEIVGSVVKSIERTGRTLEGTEDGVWRGALAGSADPKAQDLATDAGLPAHLRRAATVEAALARPDVVGGTAPGRVAAALAAARQRLEAVAAKTG